MPPCDRQIGTPLWFLIDNQIRNFLLLDWSLRNLVVNTKCTGVVPRQILALRAFRYEGNWGSNGHQRALICCKCSKACLASSSLICCRLHHLRLHDIASYIPCRRLFYILAQLRGVRKTPRKSPPSPSPLCDEHGNPHSPTLILSPTHGSNVQKDRIRIQKEAKRTQKGT